MRATADLVAIIAVIVLDAGSGLAADPKEEAKQRFDKGVALFKDGDFDAALVEFKAAYQVQPKNAVRYNIGICLYKLHRYAEASLELQTYLVDGGDKIKKERKAEVMAVLDEIKAFVGTLSVQCDVEDAQLLVDDEPSTAWLVQVDVGEHKVEVKAKGYESLAKKVEVPGGKAVTLAIDLVPAGKGASKASLSTGPIGNPKEKLQVGYFAGAAGLTGLLALTAIITGSVALKREDEYARMDATDSWQAFRNDTRRLTIGTDVLWGLVAAGAVASIVIAVFTDFDAPKEEPGPKVSLSTSGNGLCIAGVF